MMSYRPCTFFAALACFGINVLLLSYYLIAVDTKAPSSTNSLVSKNRARERDEGIGVELSVAQGTNPFPKEEDIISTTLGTSQHVTAASTLVSTISEVHSQLHQQDGHVTTMVTTMERGSVEELKTRYNQAHITRQVLVQESIQHTCQAMNNSSSPLSRWQLSYLLKHLVVDDRTRLLYCYAPKVGCANWKRVFSILYGNYNSVENISTVKHSSMKLLSSYSDDEVSYRLKNYFKFMFVRHPMDRLLSAFRNKFGEHFRDFELKYGVHIVKNFRPNPPAQPRGDDVTFSEFLTYVASTQNHELNEHWSPYTDLCQPCFVNYDYVGQFEFLEDDAMFLLNVLNLDKVVHYPKKQRYYSALSEEEKAAYFESVPFTVLQDVINKFALDFQLFGYQP